MREEVEHRPTEENDTEWETEFDNISFNGQSDSDCEFDNEHSSDENVSDYDEIPNEVGGNVEVGEAVTVKKVRRVLSPTLHSELGGEETDIPC